MTDPQTTLEMPNELFLPEVCRMLEEGHTVTLRVRGNSMRPFLEDRRDSIVIERATHFDVGDPVLAEVAPGRYVFHRIIALDGDAVTLMGDGNVRGTEHCTCRDVKATTVAFIRKGKRYAPDGKAWQRYSRLWKRLTPVRRWILAVWRRLPVKL